MNDQRFAEAAERMRAQAAAARQAESAQTTRPAAPAPAPETYYAQAPTPQTAAPAPAYAPQPAPAYAPSAAQAQAPAAAQFRLCPAAAPAGTSYAPHHGDVQLKAVRRPAAYPEPAQAPVQPRRIEQPVFQAPFVPPQAELPLRAPQMPKIEDFPIPGQP